jgi:hypothetical protein
MVLGFFILLAGFSEYRRRNPVYSPIREPSSVYDDLSWAEAVELIRDCKVTAVDQSHAREVDLTLKDGSNRRTIEPDLDGVLTEAVNAEAKCGQILMSTE